MKKTFRIRGMHCNACEQRIEQALKPRVNKVSASYKRETVEIDFNENQISENQIKEIIKQTGYEVIGPETQQKKKANTFKVLLIITTIIVVLVLTYYILQSLNLNIDVPGIGENTSLILLFVVGILTGFHCIAMCGGFVVSYTAKNAIKGHKSYKQHFVYGGSKVVSYAIIGGIFGLIGGVFAFSLGLRAGIAIFAGIFMIFYALSMFGLKFFRRFQFNPKFLTKVASSSKNIEGAYKRPLLTGLLSGLFIACGPLQAMYLYAMGTGSFFTGITSLAVFGLGTIPVMIGFGSVATAISHKTTQKILRLSAIIVLILGLIMLNRGLTVLGSPITYDSIKETIIKPETGNVILKNGYQEINMDVDRYGWQPNSFTLKKGIPVKWNINVKELTGCNNELIVQEYDLDIKLKEGLNVVEFTPDRTGTVRWSCWMGMIPGSFIITDSGEATQQQLASATPTSSGGSCGGSCGSPTCGSGGGGCGCGARR